MREVAKKRVIWKYTLDPFDPIITMVQGAKILHVDTQHNAIQLWALVDPNHNGVEKRTFMLVGTGIDFYYNRDDDTYIGTILVQDGEFVFHIFEVKSG